LGEIFLDRLKSFPARLQNGRTWPRIRGAGRSREKGGGNSKIVLYPSFPSSHRPFFPSSRTIPATPTTAEKKDWKRDMGQNDALPDPSIHAILSMDSYCKYIFSSRVRGHRERSRSKGPAVLRPIPFCGEATGTLDIGHNCSFIEGWDGRATPRCPLAQDPKNQIGPIP
jgi:hypothetical protein